MSWRLGAIPLDQDGDAVGRRPAHPRDLGGRGGHGGELARLVAAPAGPGPGGVGHGRLGGIAVTRTFHRRVPRSDIVARNGFRRGWIILGKHLDGKDGVDHQQKKEQRDQPFVFFRIAMGCLSF